jgi:uncharacterized protein (DUF4415 family)
MGEQLQNPDGFHPGDKIRIRNGSFAGTRGIIRGEVDSLLEIQLDGSESHTVTVPVEDITNYSLAARRAWQVMPKRAGRPQLPLPRKKMVSMRLDVDVWDRLGDAVELGLITNREEAVNLWLREKLDALPIKQRDSER